MQFVNMYQRPLSSHEQELLCNRFITVVNIDPVNPFTINHGMLELAGCSKFDGILTDSAAIAMTFSKTHKIGSFGTTHIKPELFIYDNRKVAHVISNHMKDKRPGDCSALNGLSVQC